MTLEESFVYCVGKTINGHLIHKGVVVSRVSGVLGRYYRGGYALYSKDGGSFLQVVPERIIRIENPFLSNPSITMEL